MAAIVKVLPLMQSAPPLLALGGGLKNTLCLVKDDAAHLSEVIGDLDILDNRRRLQADATALCEALDLTPQLLVHDRHPDFYSTELAEALAARHGVPALAVQHHHAHIAAVCAEHRHRGPVLGLALDGFGLGDDAQAWGGELLLVDGEACRRLGHLMPLALPGGDRAAREPWRMAAAALHALGRSDEIPRRWPGQPAAATVQGMLASGFNCPQTSSMGRLFDAAAGLLDVCPKQQYEGEAAMTLQQRAERHGPVAPLTDGYRTTDDRLDFLPLLACLADISDAGAGAALFHATVAQGLADWLRRAADLTGIRVVACGGGCFLNRHLLQGLQQALAGSGLTVLTAQRVSPGDSGLALGQAWIGLHHLQALSTHGEQH